MGVRLLAQGVDRVQFRRGPLEVRGGGGESGLEAAGGGGAVGEPPVPHRVGGVAVGVLVQLLEGRDHRGGVGQRRLHAAAVLDRGLDGFHVRFHLLHALVDQAGAGGGGAEQQGRREPRLIEMGFQRRAKKSHERFAWAQRAQRPNSSWRCHRGSKPSLRQVFSWMRSTSGHWISMTCPQSTQTRWSWCGRSRRIS